MAIDRVVADFLRRVQNDPLLARSLRRAPAQTLDNVGDLGARDRAMLIDAARADALPRYPQPYKLGFAAYPKRYSVRRGQDPLQLCVHHVGQDGDVGWDIVRVTGFSKGFNNPDGSKPWSSAPTNGSTKATNEPVSWNADEVGYGWSVNFTQKVPSDAELGLHAVRFPSFPRAVYFVVRKAYSEFASPILLHWPWSTMCAYAGDWGEFENLYDSYEPARLRRVSLDRPFDIDGGKHLFTHKAPLQMWDFVAQKMGMASQLDSCTSFDLHADEDILQGRQLFISVGHDEYWSAEMRNRVEDFVEAGGNAAFFSANVAWWRVRFEGPEGRIMACYKSAIDDPVGSDSPNDATTNWSSTKRPENTLTGASFRRGTMGNVLQVQVVREDPLLGGLKVGDKFPANPNILSPVGTLFSTVETDGVDYDSSYLATGMDGAPKNFTLLATTEMDDTSTLRDENLGLRGRGTIGYFSRASGGSVFMGATTDWGLLLGDPSIETITRNVIATFAKKQTEPARDWEVKEPRFPTNKWEKIRAVPRGIALLPIAQGHLLLHDTSPDPDGATVHYGTTMPSNTTTTTFWRTDPEDPWQPWTLTKLPTRPIVLDGQGNPVQWLFGYASDCLYSRAIFAADSVGMHQIDNPVVSDFKAWESPKVDFAAGESLAIAAVLKDLWTITRPEGHTRPFVYNKKRRLGRTTPPILTMTALDAKLFGVGNDGIIYCRETSPVDLVWSPVCPPPAPGAITHSLAGYYGRLFAIAGPPTQLVSSLEKVSSLPKNDHIPSPRVPREPKVLKPGAVQEPPLGRAPKIAPFERTLYWRTATSDFGSITPHMLFCRPVPSSQTGSGPRGVDYAIGQLHGNGYFTGSGGGRLFLVGARGLSPPFDPKPYTHVVRVRQDMALFYDDATGKGWVFRFNPDGTAAEVGRADYAGWTHIVYVHEANSPEPERVFFYRADADGNSVGIVGHYTDEGKFIETDFKANFDRWDLVTATWSGRLVFCDNQFGYVAWGHLDKDGHYVNDGDKPLPTAKGCEQLVPAGNEYAVFYERGGAVTIARVDEAFEITGNAGPTGLAFRNVGASALGVLLFYSPGGEATAAGVFAPDNALGGLGKLKDYDYPAFSFQWDKIVGLGVLS